MARAERRQAADSVPVEDELTMDGVLGLVHRALDSRKGEGIIILDMTDQVDYLDYLVICTAQTELHSRALTDHLTAELARYDIIVDGIHGYAHGDWIVVDYGVFVVHVFLPRTRDFYRLEELWAAGKEVALG
jgi:ribosome-associated protein